MAARVKFAFTLVLALASASGTALAAPPCPGPLPKPRYLLRGQGTLESVIVDRRGRLFFTNDDSLLRLDRRGARARVLTKVVEPGGLAFDGDGKLVVGFGNTASNGAVGDVTGRAGLLKVDPDTGASRVYATGLGMANGLVRGPDGSFYASNDFGSNIDRIRGGKTQRGWARVDSGNGLAIDRAGRYLYAAQTFRPAAIRQVELANPSHATDYVRADPADISAGLDGMTRDDADRLFVTANGAGEVWRIDRPPRICVLLSGLPGFPDGPSAAAVGRGSGPFAAGNLYVVAFNGDLIELQNVAAVAKPPRPPTPPSSGSRPQIRLTVRPGTTETGRRTEFVFRATTLVHGSARPVADARLRFVGLSAPTNRDGRARVVTTFSRPGRYRATASHRAHRAGSVAVRVVSNR